ncbi:conjugal transfer protein TrbE [Robiginitomaculum antarcticum]|uniref:conjugal transfer protein TrbE n=1 Tax=Robiginitomaculum antarcticum TaxID=437507 RepID=UPI00037BAFE4|nr:conjugal transfer protein TrbE [Robiginitomaculum antarcticum]
MMNLTEYRKCPDRLSDYLPWAALVARGVVLNKDGSFQRTAEFRGPDLESSTEEELIATCARLNNALRRFGSSWALYFEAARIPAKSYPESEFTNAAAWIVEQERRGAFEETRELYESAYYVTFQFIPPADTTNKAAKLFIETPDEETEPSVQDHLQSFMSETGRCLDLLQAQFPMAKWLGNNGTLTYLHSAVSPHRHPIKTPDTPAYIDALIGGADLVGGLVPRLGDHAINAVSILGFPNDTTPGILDELNTLGFSYRWMTRFMPLGKAEATKVITKTRRQWFAKRKSVAALLKEALINEQSVLVDSDADNKASDADAALQDLGSDYVGYGYLTTCICVMHEDAAVADARIRAVIRIINGRGFATIHEKVNAVDAWLGTHPGNPYANVRLPLVSTLNLAHMMPLSAVWAGPETNAHLDGAPLLYATTEGHTPFRLVTHQGDVGHTLVVGPTGSGKSVLLNLLSLQFKRYEGAQIFTFDKGRSSRAAILALGGDFHDLGGADTGLTFQPLQNIDDEAEIAWALEWVSGLLTSEGVVITPDIKDGVWSALGSLASAQPDQRTLTGLSALLQNTDLRQALKPFTLEGAYGHILDGSEDTLKRNSVQAFEMETLMHTKALVAPVLTYLFHKLEARFDGKPTFLILDEAWVFLDDPMFAGRIREWLKVLRKKNVSVIFATQSLADIADSPIAPAVIESCLSRIFLPNNRAMEPQQQDIYARFGLNKRQIQIVATAMPKRDYYFQSHAGNRLFDLQLGPVALAFCGAGSEQDHKDIDVVQDKAGLEAFAGNWLRFKRLEWAADLLGAEFTTNDEEDVPWLDAAE